MNKNNNSTNLQNKNEFFENLIMMIVEKLTTHYSSNAFESTKDPNKNVRTDLINLIGLFKAQNYDIPFNIDLNCILDRHLQNAEKFKGVGELGLLLWATALISPKKLPIILTKVNFNLTLTNYKDAKSRCTKELSWLLTGLIMASTFNKVIQKSIGNVIQDVYNEIRKNYIGSGIFKHQSKQNFIGKFRTNLADFEDQVFPLYAFTLFGKKFHFDEASLISEECALKLCELQDRSGEWMWNYNPKNGTAVNKYPVFTLNQLALAPLALYSVQKASDYDFSQNISDGINFIKDNSDYKFINLQNKTIINGIAPNNILWKINSNFNALKNSNSKDLGNDVKLKNDSFHYGWILHALLGRSYKPNTHSQKSVKTKIPNIFILN
jgi:hypothetical protein